MSHVINVFSLGADETVFIMNDNSWPTHTDTNTTVCSFLHKSNSSNMNSQKLTIIHIGVLVLHYVEFWVILLTMTLRNFRVFHVHTAIPPFAKWIIRMKPFWIVLPGTPLTSHMIQLTWKLYTWIQQLFTYLTLK